MEHKFSVIDTETAEITSDVTESGEGRFGVICKTHAHIFHFGGRAAARAAVADGTVLDFCERAIAPSFPAEDPQPEVPAEVPATTETVKAPRGVKFTAGCDVCKSFEDVIRAGEKARDNLRAKKRAAAKNTKITQQERKDAVAKIDAEIAKFAEIETSAKFAAVKHNAKKHA